MLTVDIRKAIPLVETGVMTKDDFEDCLALWTSFSYVIGEIHRGESELATTGFYPQGYQERNLLATLETDIDEIIGTDADRLPFYRFLSEVMSTDVSVLNDLINRKNRE